MRCAFSFIPFYFSFENGLIYNEIKGTMEGKGGDRMKILNFGSCNIDYVYSVDHIVIPGETEASAMLEQFPGGKGLNQSIAAARAGATVYHAGAIGADGELLRRVLADNGVDTRFLRTSEDRTGHAIIQLSKEGQNSILLYRGANGSMTHAYVDEVLSHFDAGDVLVMQNEINLVPYIMERAAARGMRILFNPAPFSADLATLDYSKVTYLVLNEIEACGLGGAPTPNESLQRIRAAYPTTAVVMTLGGDGCVYADATQSFSHPAYCVPVVDTTAAGDTFIGYFLAALVHGEAPKMAVKKASAASAISVSRKGAATSIPTAKELAKALHTLQPISASATREERLCAEIEAYIDAHLVDATLVGLAAHIGYAESYVGELVRHAMDTSFSALLQQKRCAAAASLLLESDLSVQEIIARVGYRNESFFRDKFKQRYGVSPYHYKKKGGVV